MPQPPTAEQLQQAQTAAKDRGALWKLSKDDCVSYLYGTVHVGKLAMTYVSLSARRDGLDPTFVGLLYMTGEQALPRLLQERGFEVERVRY